MRKYMRVWQVGVNLHWIITDDSPKQNAVAPQAGVDHAGKFNKSSSRGAVLNSLLTDDVGYTNRLRPDEKEWRFPLDSYVIACDYAGVKPFVGWTNPN